MSPTRVVYLTGGTVGAGHLMRGLALRRALERGRVQAELDLWSPSVPFPDATAIVKREVVIDPEGLRDPRRAPETALGRALASASANFDILIVDLFWAPVRYLLSPIAKPVWLLVRKVPPAWWQGPTGVSFDASQFDRIISIEPVEGSPATDHIGPVVVCNPDEQRSAGELRRHFGVGPGEAVRLAVQAGLPGEADVLARPGFRVVDLHQAGALFPAAPWLGGADELRMGAGYNAYWEARWLGYAARTTFVPFPRRIDDQAWRLRAGAEVAVRENGADVLARWIAQG